MIDITLRNYFIAHAPAEPMHAGCPWHTKNQLLFRVHDSEGGAQD